MATFTSATAAVSCAIAIQEASRAHDREHPEAAFRVRIGLNAGEPVAEEADVYGTAVQLAARICAEAAPGQILASDVVRQLVAGKGLLFNGLGAVAFKGFDAAVPVFEIRAEAEVGEQLWRDAGQQRRTRAGRRLLSWPVLAGAGALGLGTAAIVIPLLLLGGEGGTAARTDFRELRLRQESMGTMAVIPGDCVTTDIVFEGSGDVDVTGDQAGTASSAFEARVGAASACTVLRLTYTTVYTFAGSDRISVAAAGYSSQPLIGIDLENLAGGAEVIDRGVLFGGTGVYEGVGGTASCRSFGLRVGAAIGDEIGFESSGNCTFALAPASELDAITLVNVADATMITTQGGAAGARDQVTVAVVYRHNREDALTGVTLSLAMPPGVRLDPVGEDATVDGDSVRWSLPDLAGDGVATFEFTVRLISSEADVIVLVPEVTADQLDVPIRGDSLSLAVVR
jgi:hypothetical protein